MTGHDETASCLSLRRICIRGCFFGKARPVLGTAVCQSFSACREAHAVSPARLQELNHQRLGCLPTLLVEGWKPCQATARKATLFTSIVDKEVEEGISPPTKLLFIFCYFDFFQNQRVTPGRQTFMHNGNLTDGKSTCGAA